MTPLPHWKRPAQILVYLVPVGGISSDLFTSYARLLLNYSELPLRSLTRPGGYSPELSPFCGLDWSGAGSMRFLFVSTAERIDSCDGDDVHASHRVIGALGVCHSPSLTLSGGLRAAHAQFEASIRSFTGLVMHKLFAFEHAFEDATASECEGLSNLVMFPVHHELEGTGESTVSLHLQVVMETIAVNILMALESAIRSATSSAVPDGVMNGGDLTSVLLDVNVEPHASQLSNLSPLVLSRDFRGDDSLGSVSCLIPRSSLPSSLSIPTHPSPRALDPRHRRRKRHLARRKKLLGDYSLLVSCVSQAMDHYVVAIDMLREEERRSGGAAADALWLAAALERLAYCLYTNTLTTFSTELVEKASEAVAFYAKAGTIKLESLLIENMGRYYARVAMASLTCTVLEGEARLLESVWIKCLLWDVLERGLMLLPGLQPQRQIEYLIQSSHILETLGHGRRVAFLLHEAAAILLARNAPCIGVESKRLRSHFAVAKGSQQERDLEAALLLERMAARCLNIQDIRTLRSEQQWHVSTVNQRNCRKNSSKASSDNSWPIIRFHVLRQLLAIAELLGDALLVGTYCLQLLDMLIWCDSIVQPSIIKKQISTSKTSNPLDHLQQPALSLRKPYSLAERAALGLHAKSGIFCSPPPRADTKTRRNFTASPSATMTNAAASLSSTLSNTPRILATPRQQFSAAVSALSTKASPAFAPFAHAHFQSNESLTSRAGDEEDRKLAAKEASVIDVGGIGLNEVDGLKSARMSTADASESDCKTHAINFVPVWNLQSKAEIKKFQQNLLHVLDLECTMLRSSDQAKLRTFLQVNKLKLRSICNLMNPFFSRKTALEMFEMQSKCDKQAINSEFYYSPFEKQKCIEKANDRGRKEERNDRNDAPSRYERGFPVNDRIELQLILSNPTGIHINLLEVKAWVTFENGGIANKATKDVYVKCYSRTFSLDPYQKRKSVVLEIQPLQEGILNVRGCFFKAFNIKTLFLLEIPLIIRVVRELPLVLLCIHEHTSTAHSNGEKAEICRELASTNVHLAMMSTETRRCLLCIHCVGKRKITNFRLAVSLQTRYTAKKYCVIYDNLQTALSTANSTLQSKSESTNANGVCEQLTSKALVFRYSSVVSSPVPIASGDCVRISFEVSLREISEQQEKTDDSIVIEWSVVYADETGSSKENIFYRETKLIMKITPLSALVLQSVTLLPRNMVGVPINCRLQKHIPDDKSEVTTNHSCFVIIQVINPTEIGFRFRMRRRDDNSEERTCEADIECHCSRRFVIEVPRIYALVSDSGDHGTADVLNDLLAMEWETYFGSRGSLRINEFHLGFIAGMEQVKMELSCPPVNFYIQPFPEISASGLASGEQNGGTMKLGFGKERDLSTEAPKFVQVTNTPFKSQTLHVEVFQYVPVAVVIQRADIASQQPISGVEVEVIITDENEESCFEMNDYVMVVGLLRTLVQWTELMDSSIKKHKIQCMFLSEGNFCVTVRGRVLDGDGQRAGNEIRAHEPLHVHVRLKDVSPTI
ncbi:uncharacterized protein CCR75_008833 [Bremia lactucae]|uniref:Trs120/TRAPPC9 N-terminal domain-containing protein n=1 Tax=Bremia lactucae TaxID=4779 RepID=A0A976FGS0_BRELC|nr:hypothetical protein CCR75_008833 [Bremia lactucae]